MILITDAHVSTANENVSPFFAMLDKIESYDGPIVFLGDIFDLWVALPGYEEEIQQRFIAWCRRRKDRHGVGFVEGNHEFFVVRRHQDAFCWSDGARHQDGALLLVHGDLINPDDRSYLLFRKITRSPFIRTLVRFLPFGKHLVHKIKQRVNRRENPFKMGLPEEHLATFAKNQFQQGISHVLVGHFHVEYRVDGEEGRFLQILPDWFATRKLTVYDGTNVDIKHWEAL